MWKSFVGIALVVAGCGSTAGVDGGVSDSGVDGADANVEVDAQVEDPCASEATCGSCTARAGCGFCAETGACASGSTGGPSEGTCETWAWLQSDCESECVPDCDGRTCGDDGCGGSCGTCESGFMCSANECVSEPTSTWAVALTDGTIDEQNSDGDAWDIGGGAPDATLCLTIGGTETCSPTVDDTLTPSWDPPFSFGSATRTALQSGVPWVLRDTDVSNHDEICSGSIAPDEDAFSAGELTVTCELASFHLTLTLE